ncbi:MAG TPA: hypothetical protein VKU41_08185, partial [Polyangiaceae bacterium]|nr:hypothetical protein [Polyangiaceae bacterium]
MTTSTGVLRLTVACAVVSLVPRVAGAQMSGNDKVTAEALFEDARALVAQGKYAEACPKFAGSQRLDPSPATLLNLANCWEKAGRTASAWATYKEAASLANAVGRKDYLAAAERHAEALVPKLARLTLTVQQPAEGMQVMRDGAPVDRAEWGTALPIDSGSHSIDATAPGHKGWASTVDVAKDGAQVSVTVPPLEALPADAVASPAPPLSAAPPAAPAPAAPPSETTPSNGSAQRIVGLVVGGVGIVGLGVGTVLAISAKGKDNDSLKFCETANPDLCSAAGLSDRSTARSLGDAATVALGLGA